MAQLAAIVADENREAAVEADEQQRQLAGFGCWLNALGAVQRRAVFPQHPGQGGSAQLQFIGGAQHGLQQQLAIAERCRCLRDRRSTIDDRQGFAAFATILASMMRMPQLKARCRSRQRRIRARPWGRRGSMPLACGGAGPARGEGAGFGQPQGKPLTSVSQNQPVQSSKE